MQVNGDIWSESEPEDMNLASNVISVHLVNPLTTGDFDVIEDAEMEAIITFPLNTSNTENIYVSFILLSMSFLFNGEL